MQQPPLIDFNRLLDVILPSRPNPLQSLTIGGIISFLLSYIFRIAGILLLILLVLGGYDVLTSQGEPKRMASGKDKITYAIVGFIVIFVSYWIVQIISRILNLRPIIEIFR